MYLNADSVSNKLDELELLIQDYDADIVAITETLPKNSRFQLDTIIVQGYHAIMNNQGRGVCLLVRNYLDVVVLDQFTVFQPSVLCRVQVGDGETLLVGVLYRSPNCTEEENKNVCKYIDEVVFN